MSNDTRDDLFVEEVMNSAALSLAAYADDPVNSMTEIGRKCCHTVANVQRAKDIDDSGFSYLLAISTSGTVYCIVRGSQSWINWVTNFSAYGAVTVDDGIPGMVHSGFKDYADKLPFALLAGLAEEGRRVVLGGHSLGGAVASIGCVMLMARVRRDVARNIDCFTFGAPLFGTNDLGRELTQRKQVDRLHHFVNEDDIVPVLLSRTQYLNAGARDLTATVLRYAFGSAFDMATFVGRTLAGNLVDNVASAVGAHLNPAYSAIGKFRFARPPVSETDDDALALSGRVEDDAAYQAQYFMEQDLDKRSIEYPACLHSHVMDHYVEVLRQANGFCDGYKCGCCLRRNSSSSKEIDVAPVHTVEMAPYVLDFLSKERCLCGFVKPGKVLNVTFQGYGIGLVESLVVTDVKAVVGLSGREPTTSPVVRVVELIRTHRELRYEIHVDECPLTGAITALDIQFRSRFSFTGVTDLKITVPVETAWFMTRRQRINNASILDLVVLIRHNCEVLATAGGDSGSAAPESIEYNVRLLDEWLKSAKDLKLKQKEREYVDRVGRALAPPCTVDLQMQDGASIVEALLLELLTYADGGSTARVEELEELRKQVGEVVDNLTPVESPLWELCFGAKYTDANIALQYSADFLISVAMLSCVDEVVGMVTQNARYNAARMSAAIAALGAGGFVAGAYMMGGLSPVIVTRTSTSLMSMLGLPAAAWGALQAILGTARLASDCFALLTYTTPFAASFVQQRQYYRLFDDTFASDRKEDTSLSARESRILGWIDKPDEWDNHVSSKEPKLRGIHGAYRDQAIKRFRALAEPLRMLRQITIEMSTFTVGIVGEPGSGKSSLASELTDCRYEERTAIPLVYTLQLNGDDAADDSDVTYAVRDFPGMLGTDAFAGARIEVLQQAVGTLDAVVIVMCAESRSFPVDRISRLVRNIPTLLCLTKADQVFGERCTQARTHEKAASGSNRIARGRAAKLEETVLKGMAVAKEGIRVKNSLTEGNACFLCPSEDVERLYPEVVKRWRDPDDEDAAMVKNSDHVKCWLTEQFRVYRKDF